MASNIIINKNSSKKKKLSELEGFSVDRTYYNEVAERLKGTNVNETVNLINSGKYIDSETLQKHKDRLRQYKSDLDFINRTQKLMSKDYDESSYIESSKWLEDFANAFNERESILSKFKTEDEYNEYAQYLKTQDEMRGYDSVSGKSDITHLKAQLSALEKEKNDLDTSYKANGGWTPSASNYNRPAYSQIGAYNEWNAKSSEYAQKIKDLENEIYQKERYHTEAVDLQEFEGFQGIIENEDFDEKSQKGLSRSNPSPNKVETIEKGEDGKWYTTGALGKKKEIKNILTFVQDNADSYGNVSINEDFQKMLKATDDEVRRYSYLLEVDEAKAQRYLDLLMPTLLDKRSDDLKEKFDVPVLKHTMSVDQGMANYIDSVGIKDFSNDSSMVAMQKLQSEAEGLDKYLMGAGQNIGNMLPSIMLAKLTGGLASGLGASTKVASAIGSLTNATSVGISAKGSAYKQKIAEGWNPNDAETYSTLVGVSEASLEALLSGIIGTTGFGAEDLLAKADMIDKALLRFTAKSAIRLSSEELEELAQLFLEPTFEVIVRGGEYNQPTIDEMIETAIVTAISTGTLNSPATISDAVDSFKKIQLGKYIKDAGETRNLVDLGKSLGEGTKSYELANKITDKSKGLAVKKLLDVVKGDIANANKGDIVKSLERKGYSTEVANNLAEMMLDPENTMFENSRGLSAPSQTYNDIINNPNSTVGQRNEAYEGILRSVAENRNKKANRQNTKADTKPTNTAQSVLPLSPNYVEKRTEQLVASGIPIEQAVQVAQGEFAKNQGKMSTQTEKAVESKFESNTEGKDFNMANDKVIASKKLVASEKDKMAFEVTYEDGTTEEVDANNINFGNEGEALVYSTVMDMNLPVGIAESLISGYKGNDINSAGTYISGVREAFTFGKHNQEADLKNGASSSLLTEEQRNTAFNLGKIYANEKAIADTKAIVGETNPTSIKKREGKLHFEGDKLSLTSVQDVSIENLKVLTLAIGKDIHIFESYVDENGNYVYKDANGNIKKAPNGFYRQLDGSIWIDLNAGSRGQGTMMYTVAHELTHFIKQWSPTKFKALADFLVEQYGKEGVSVHQLVLKQQQKAKDHGRNISYDVAFEEMVADSMETMLTDGKVIRELAKKDKGLFNKIKSWIDNLLRRLNKEYKNYSPESAEGQKILEMTETFKEVQKLFAEALTDASDNFAVRGSDKAFVENYLKTQDVVYNLRAAESHQDKLAEKYTTDASIDLETLQERYSKIIGIWEKLGGELNSKFLNEWNNKIGKDRAFTIFKAQSGYKYNVELSSMCKKGVPLFEAIDTIVKKEVMNELKTKTLGKAEKEILYDILKNHNFEIPCAICYVEQARQREGVIINDFLDGKIEKNAKGKITKYKLGWNDVLNRVEKEMKKNGVDYTFRNVDKSIATDSYAPADITMDETTQDAFYKALKKVANAEIVRWNREERKSNQKERRQITDLKPQTMKEVFKGTLPSNLKIFKVLFNNPSSRFKISRDLLYSSATTLNLANAHNDLYSLFNSQGGVAGYKTKQAPIVYWGDILGKSWRPSTVRKEGGIRNQSNSDFQMYTLLDQAQMYIDFSAKGYYLQAYTKVLAELKLFGLSRGKINASLIPQVIEYKNADGSINWAKTMENAGLDENGNPIYDDFEGINHTEAFMLIEDAEYSKNICGICIGYSDNHIRKLLDDNRVQQIIGFHDKTDNPEKRYRGAKYAKNYNGLNEAVKTKADGTEETVHIGFNQFVSKAEKMFKFNKKTETFEGTVNHNGKEYSANDIPRLAADLYLEMCAEKNYKPAYNDFASHKNYYKLLADFGLYDSQGSYAPHQKVQYNMPDQVPYLDKNGNKAYMSTEAYIKAELQKELTVRDSISEALADTSENGIIPQFVERVNALHSEKADTTLYSERNKDLTDNDLLEYMSVGKKLHTRNKKQRMLEAGKKPILTSSVETKEFISNIIHGKAQGEVRAFKKIGKRLADAIHNKRSTLDMLGKYLELNADDLRESYKRHSSPKEKGDIPLSEQDFERIPEFMDEFDGVLSVNTYNDKIEVHLYKETDDGYVRILTVVSNERNSLQVSKLIGVSKEKFEQKYAKKIERNIGSPQSLKEDSNPSTTVRHTADVLSKDSISPLEEKVKRFSERDTDSVSTRSLLANALEGAAQNEIEKNKLAQYKEKIALIEAEQKKLHELREKLFTKGIKGDERRKIQDEATKTANRITTYDRQLFNLEATTALKNVLNREKELARKRQKLRDAENLREYKEKVAETTRQLLEKNRQSREKAIEGRNKTEMRHKIKKVVGDLNNLLLKPTKERHIPEEMRVAVAEALDIINMDTVDAETRVAKYNELIAKEKNPDVIASLTESRDRILNQGNKLGEKLKNLKDAYGMIRDSADDDLKSMYDDVIYNKIESVQKKVGKTPLRNMTLEQLENVYELYKMVLTTVRDSNKAFAEDLKMTRQALGSNTFAEIKENNKARDRIRFEGAEKFGWKYLKPMLAMKTIGSDSLQKLWNNILYGQEVFAQDYDEAVKFAKEMKKKYGYKEWDLHKLYSFESKSGKVMKINLEQMMSIYAYSKRKQADEHIEKGGILLNESIIKEKKLGRTVEVKVNDSTAYRLDKMQVGEIIDTLEKIPGAKDFVDEMQKYLSETMGEKGNEVSMKMYGIKLFKEEHYFPLKSSKDFMESANAKLKGDVKIKNKGMTKATVEHASNPIVLEGFLDVWGNHINEMAMYHGLVLPLEDFSRTLNYGFKADDKLNADAESVRTALRSAFGESADNYLNELLKAINGGVLHDSSTEFADKMISTFKKSKVMASLSVIVQQPTAIIRAMGIIEPKYFTSQNFHHKQTWEELKKYCPTAIIKETGSFDTNMGRTIVDMVKEDRKLTEKVGDALGKAPAWMDEMGWNMIWRALKKKVATEQNLSGEALLKECGKQMTLIINETQVYDSVMSRNEFMRSKGAFTKMATAFMGEPTTVANMIYGAVLDVKRGNKRMAGKTVAAVISSVVINGLVSSLVYALRDDDEEKTWLEKYLASATTEAIDGINLLTYIPYIKDAYSLFQGYDVERTDMALIGDVVDALDDFFNVFDPEAYEDMSRGEIAKHIYESSIPLLTSICDMFGLPVGNILRDAKAIILNDNLPMSKTSSEGSGLAVKEGWLNASPKFVEKFVGDEKYHKLYLIANNGDTAYVKNEVAEMVAEKFDSYKDEETTSKKAENKAKQSVKSSFTGVYRDEYKKAYKNKDSEEMNRIRKFLYATGLWKSLSELDSLLAKWREAD